MRKPLENIKTFRERRARLGPVIGDGVLVVASAPERIRNNSHYYSYRPDSNLYYLTGWEEPDSVFVYRPGRTPETVLFVRKKDPLRETWDGFRFGPEGAKAEFGMESVYLIEELDEKLPELLKGADRLYYRQFKHPAMDRKMEQALLNLRALVGRTGFGLLPVLDADELIGEARVLKTDSDIENLKTACKLSAAAHVELMKMTKPGVNERELQGAFIYNIMKRGASHEGYASIVASGTAACTLHYIFNDQPCKDGDLLLVDAGGEYNYFTADITRTYPVNARFTDAQAEVYQGVLDIQKAIIATVKPGLPFKEMHDMGTSLLTDLMLKLGLLKGRKDDIIKANEQKRYYPHGIGHFLGMDVHDAGMYFSRAMEPRKIQPGMVFTVEPGLYIPPQDPQAAPKYQGIGVRIEDNILVTSGGCEVLTRDCPKEIADLEKIIGTN